MRMKAGSARMSARHPSISPSMESAFRVGRTSSHRQADFANRTTSASQAHGDHKFRNRKYTTRNWREVTALSTNPPRAGLAAHTPSGTEISQVIASAQVVSSKVFFARLHNSGATGALYAIDNLNRHAAQHSPSVRIEPRAVDPIHSWSATPQLFRARSAGLSRISSKKLPGGHLCKEEAECRHAH